MSILQNKERIGNPSSSDIYKLLTGKGENGFGAPAITYITEKNIERKMGRSIETESYSRDMAWGSLLEYRVFDMLDYGYELVSNVTNIHPDIPYWVGSTDLIFPGVKIGEIKCYQPKNFSLYTDAILKKDPAFIKENFPKEYWQMISNAIINGVSKAEAISYMPFRSELPQIRELADNYDGPDQWKYRFIAESEDGDLAYLPDGGYYNNLNRFEFEVPKDDIELLTAKVKLAGTMLIKELETASL